MTPARKASSILLLALAVAGCTHPQQRRSLTRMTPATAEAVADKAEAKRRATLTLDQIGPPVELPAARHGEPDPAPLQALALYAQARGQLDDNQRFTAIKLLEQVVALDPLRPAPYLLLAEALLGDGTFNDKSIGALKTAVELDPLDTSARTELGRQYLAKGDAAAALRELRLVLLTPGYSTRADAAALADLTLARALQRGGYDLAAAEQYERLLDRLRTRDLRLRKDREMAVLVAKPELISVEIGRLYERIGRHDKALEALKPAADSQPQNFELQALVTQLMYETGDREAAIDRATELVSRFRASTASVALLRDVAKGQPPRSNAAARLRKLLADRPNDRAILFALSDTLRADGRAAEATKILTDALGEQSAGVEITRRLFAVYDAQNDVKAAGRLLIETAARQNDAASELLPLWLELTRTSRPGRLRAADVESLDVSKSAAGAKLYFLANCPEVARRPARLRQALQSAVDVAPPFAPAYRQLFNVLWAMTPDDEACVAIVNPLATAAKEKGDEALSLELQGIIRLRLDDPRGAVKLLSQALRLGPGSPDRTLNAAAAYEAAGNGKRFEQVLWKLLSDRPTHESAYTALFSHYLAAGESAAAVKVLSTWLASDPTSVDARLLQASVFRQSGQVEAAEQVLLNLVDEQPRNLAVLVDLYTFYAQAGRLDDFVTRLEALRTTDPTNRAAAETLVEVYAEQQRFPDAARVLDAMRAATPRNAPADADLLYYYAGLYTRVRQSDTAEQMLEQAVALEPTHAGASNDLGYSWADAGKNLDRAEAMIRVAVTAEPENASFLDSLGWVLYKRGQFAEAASFLRKAVAAMPEPDPVLLDHLGDAQYRLNQDRDARQAWQQSLDRINGAPEPRDDLKELKLKLMMKLKQAAAGQAVNVAPTASPNANRSTAALGDGR